MSNSLQHHGLQHARFLCPSLFPGVCLNSCPLSQHSSSLHSAIRVVSFEVVISPATLLLFFFFFTVRGKRPTSCSFRSSCLRSRGWSQMHQLALSCSHAGLTFFRKCSNPLGTQLPIALCTCPTPTEQQPGVALYYLEGMRSFVCFGWSWFSA